MGILEVTVAAASLATSLCLAGQTKSFLRQRTTRDCEYHLRARIQGPIPVGRHIHLTSSTVTARLHPPSPQTHQAQFRLIHRIVIFSYSIPPPIIPSFPPIPTPEHDHSGSFQELAKSAVSILCFDISNPLNSLHHDDDDHHHHHSRRICLVQNLSDHLHRLLRPHNLDHPTRTGHIHVRPERNVPESKLIPRRLHRTHPERLAVNAAQHRAIVAAIRDGDGAAARARMSTHLAWGRRFTLDPDGRLDDDGGRA